MTLFLSLLVGLFLGFALSFFYKRQKAAALEKEFQNRINELEKQKDAALSQLNIDLAVATEQKNTIKQELERTEEKLESEKDKNDKLLHRQAFLEANNKSLSENLETHKKELHELHEKFNKEFELIAAKVVKDNSREMTNMHSKSIKDILTPLKEKISSFEKKVEEAYDKELRDKVDLKTELKSLHELNKRISQEANNLTRALKGDSKKQGNWGEVILERVLERSGLTKGQEYDLQYNTKNDEGRRIQPDVLISLPDRKCIVIDAKVSLSAYEKFVNEDDEKLKSNYLKEHLQSVKNHINGLSEKKYYNAADIISPEFVLMFMPIESSFSTALQADVEIFTYAWDKKIVVVSPTTLLATLRTIASIWQQENQTKNALEIARQSGNLYDKFVNFIADLEKIGRGIETLEKAHTEAMKKLTIGTGNLVGRAEAIKKLGAKASKNIPEKFKQLDTKIE